MPRAIEEILREVRIRDLELEEPCRVDPDTPLGEVYRRLDVERPGAVLVCEEGRVIGVFTDRDVLYRTALEGFEPSTPIRDLMTPDPVTARADQRLAEAISAMIRGGHRRVPLRDGDGRDVGIVSGRDILRFIAGHYPEAVLNLPPRLHQQMSRPEGG